MADSGPLVQAIGVEEGAGDIRLLSLMTLAGVCNARYNLHTVPVGARIRHMSFLRREAWAGAASLLIAATLVISLGAQKSAKDKDQKDSPDAGRPKVTLKAQPVVAMAPARIVLTAELVGGANDFEEYYCNAVEWEWGDGTKSESANDCPPYEAGKSEIKRRFTVEHVFRAGMFRVYFHLKRHDKMVGNATVNVQVRPGLRDGQ